MASQKKRASMSQVAIVGIDLARRVFHLRSACGSAIATLRPDLNRITDSHCSAGFRLCLALEDEDSRSNKVHDHAQHGADGERKERD